MAATFNLVRNSRVWFTGNVDAVTGKLPTSGATITNSGSTATVELTVLDGFSFSQSTQQSTIQLNEAGNTPVRGQRAFNTSLDPVDFSFSTYLRPAGTVTTVGAIEEAVLWNALLCNTAIDTTGTPITLTSITRGSATTAAAAITCTAVSLTAAGIAIGDVFMLAGLASTVTNVQEWAAPAKLISITGTMAAATVLNVEYLTAPGNGAAATMAGAGGTAKLLKCAFSTQTSSVSTPAYANINTAFSNKNQLQKFGMFFLVDNAVYGIDNCVLDQASIDFGLDSIATIAWTGKGTALNYLPSATISSANPAVFGGTGIATGTATTRVLNTASNYITNKLSTMTLISKIMGTDTAVGTTYTVPLTGGNLTIANNVNYVVPANLGVVNVPVGYFTGTRSISGNVTAYLKVGTNNSAQLLTDVIAQGAETKFKVQIEVGGLSNAIRAEFEMNGCVLQVPTVETGDVMATTINFSAQGFDPTPANAVYDIGQTNDLNINYYSA
jgi:hypothetical protein